MTVVTSIIEIEENLQLFEDYLCEGTDEEQLFCSELIRKGSCFIAYEIESELRFCPSRYIGYSKNTVRSHIQRESDGKETNPAITKVLGKLTQSDKLEQMYIKYCSDLGLSPFNKKRKFWSLSLKGTDFISNQITDEGFPEGKIVERKHAARERNAALVKSAKEAYKKLNKRLFCQACDFDFEKVYGERGSDYIEAHHIVPVSDMVASQKTKITDIAMVCSNCHRILHRSRPWLTVDQLKELIAQKT
ncbi:HNH endonuclease [Pseudomonas sp. EA_65y_Pfl1_P120]|uniref:HNH endonuclease n=1 Tax=Pseudomonas sp. EA_65y_Pfl1_P120 TaxID=3088693 RepID=UPI0030D9B963